MHAVRLVLTLGWLLLAGSVSAASLPQVKVSLNDVIATVEQSTLIVRDVTADFFQRSTIAKDGRDLRGSGKMLLRLGKQDQPLMFRFDYYQPTNHQIVCDGVTLWTYLPDDRQAIVSDVGYMFDPARFRYNRGGAINFLQGMGQISRDFLITFASQPYDVAGNYVLELSPRRPSELVGKLQLVVNRLSVLWYVQNNRTMVYNQRNQALAFPLLSSTLIDPQGNTTTMEFSNIHTEIVQPDLLFRFQVPAGVDVVRPPTKPGPGKPYY